MVQVKEIMMSTQYLSEGARKLADLAGMDGDVVPILTQHPDLMASLDEFIKWRQEESKLIAHSTTERPVGHSLSVTIKRIAEEAKKG
jgi:hypothetical protein